MYRKTSLDNRRREAASFREQLSKVQDEARMSEKYYSPREALRDSATCASLDFAEELAAKADRTEPVLHNTDASTPGEAWGCFAAELLALRQRVAELEPQNDRYEVHIRELVLAAEMANHEAQTQRNRAEAAEIELAKTKKLWLTRAAAAKTCDAACVHFRDPAGHFRCAIGAVTGSVRPEVPCSNYHAVAVGKMWSLPKSRPILKLTVNGAEAVEGERDRLRDDLTKAEARAETAEDEAHDCATEREEAFDRIGELGALCDDMTKQRDKYWLRCQKAEARADAAEAKPEPEPKPTTPSGWKWLQRHDTSWDLFAPTGHNALFIPRDNPGRWQPCPTVAEQDSENESRSDSTDTCSKLGMLKAERDNC